MGFILYIIFGSLEIYALFALMLKTFRLPYIEYFKEISIIALTTSFVSYVIRVHLEINMLVDTATHLIFYIIFFRFLLKVRVWRAFVISLMYIGYGVISTVVFLVLSNLKLISAVTVISDSNSLAAYIVQITTAALSLFIAYTLYKMNLGFSFIIRPPHDFFIKSKVSRSDLIVITSVCLTFIALFISLFLIFESKSFESVSIMIFPYIVLVYLAYKRDMKL